MLLQKLFAQSVQFEHEYIKKSNQKFSKVKLMFRKKTNKFRNNTVYCTMWFKQTHVTTHNLQCFSSHKRTK